ncbi:TonB family protein [Hymenobacter canadensis]|uniref:TonB family protein n=1 Tax=Hymenobacter canadensis TaxID=2999067 RepID=A0ABY7LR70_9BACT|nr:TonB family protein [Hymenobacter canadensis]WBA41393.1 TonB family protein [Hymenobacter canadensis]
MSLLSATASRCLLLTGLLTTLPLLPLLAQKQHATSRSLPAAPADEPIYETHQVEIWPEYASGLFALKQSLKSARLPAEVHEGRIRGAVYVGFVVRSDGHLTDISVLRGLSPGTDAEALRLIKAMPPWRPARRLDQAVAVRHSVPVVFENPSGKTPNTPAAGTITEDASISKAYTFVEQMPVFPGGMDSLRAYIQQQVKYPALALREKIEGRVFVRFVVSTDGSIREVQVQKGLGSGCDEEALRVIKSLPRFEPGKQNGRAVPVYYTVPVVFSLTPPRSSDLMDLPAYTPVSPQPEPAKVYTYVEQMPTLSGSASRTSLGAAVQQALVLPPEVREGRTEGTVFLHFVVQPTGTISDLKVVRSLCPTCDEAALAAVRALPSFEPGRQNGQAVAVQLTVPVPLLGPNHVFEGGQVATPASFPGGGPALRQYLSKELKEPKVLKQENLRSAVEVRFVVQADGSIGAAEIIRPLCRSCDEEALRLVRAMPRWTPARNAANQPVSVRQQVIIPMPAAELPPRGRTGKTRFYQRPSQVLPGRIPANVPATAVALR